MDNSDYKIFVSYSTHDSWIAQQLGQSIRDQGSKTFLYEMDVDIGDDFESEIIKNLKPCKELVVLLTPWSLDKYYLWIEIGAAMVLEIRIAVVVYGFEEGELLKKESIPVQIKATNRVKLNDVDKYFDQLKERILVHENELKNDEN